MEHEIRNEPPTTAEVDDDPTDDANDPRRCSEPVEDEDGVEHVICQDAAGAERVVGGGEFPDPARPPESPAPGASPS